MTEASPVASPSLRIDLTLIDKSKTNPRTEFTAPDIAELAASIKKHGVFQPLLLRPHPSKAGRFELVDGERRYRAAKEAGQVDVPAAVSSFSDDEVLEIQIVSFLQRKDLTPMEEAQCFNTMLTKRYTHERIAEKVGKSVQYVRDRCRLLRLVKGAQELLSKGRIEVGHAILLARLDPEDQVNIIRDPVINNYGGSQSSGLWQRQRSLPQTSEEVARDHTLRSVADREKDKPVDDIKAVSVRELAAYIDEHVKLRTDAPETAELFPQVAEILRDVDEAKFAEKPLKVIHITFEHVLADEVKKVEGPRVYGPRSWVRADGKAGSKTCASSVAGIVIAGPARGEGFQVCIAKKVCQVHYKAEIAAAKKRQTEVEQSGKTGAERAELEKAKKETAEKKAKESHDRFVRALPAIHLAIAEKVKTAPLAKLQASIEEELRVDEGLKLAAKLLPAPKTPEAWIRTMALALLTEASANFSWVRRIDIDGPAKQYGVDVEKIIASANENEAATKAARKKPAPKATKTKAKK